MKVYLQVLLVLIIMTAISCSETSPDIDTEIPETNEEPYTLNIEYDGEIPIDNKVNFTLDELLDGERTSYESRIERRGGFSIIYPKHSYEIDLDEDISLAGLPADDDWILNANYIDKTFLRHVFSYDLFSRMNENNLVSGTSFIELQLNGEYNGLYVLMEKLDKSSLEIDGSDPEGMIFKEPHIFRESYDDVVPQDADNFHQQTFPKIEDEDKRITIESLREFILMSSDTEFENGISEIFDVDNIIDWHLLLLISNNNDGILKNFYLYKIDSETPIRIAPWDYDHSFGRDGDNELNLDERPLNIERSILFKRLLENEWYKTKLKDRWENLNASEILSVAGLKNKIITDSDAIRTQVDKNFEHWSVADEWYYDSNDFDQEIDIMLQFIDLRHDRLVEYFDTF